MSEITGMRILIALFIASVVSLQAAPLRVVAGEAWIGWLAQQLGAEDVEVSALSEWKERAEGENAGAASVIVLHYQLEQTPFEPLAARQALGGLWFDLNDGLPRVEVPEALLAYGDRPVGPHLTPQRMGYFVVAISEILAEQRPEGAEAFFLRAEQFNRALRLEFHPLRRAFRGNSKVYQVEPRSALRFFSLLDALGVAFRVDEDGIALGAGSTGDWKSPAAPLVNVGHQLLSGSN